MRLKTRRSGLARVRNGASLIEYATLVGLIGTLAIGSVLGLGQILDRTYTEVAEALPGDASADAGGMDPVAPAPPGGGGMSEVPDAPVTACVDVNQSLLSSVSSGSTTLADEGISDCVNIGWDTGMIGFDDPTIGLSATPFFINLGPTALPSGLGASVWTPSANTMLTVSQPIADTLYNVNPSGPLHLTIVGYQAADLIIVESETQYVVTFPNDAVLVVNGSSLETVKIGDAPREVFEVEPLDFSQPFTGASLSIMGYNASTQGPNPPAQSITNLIYDGSTATADAFEAFGDMNDWTFTVEFDPIVESSGYWTDYGHDEFGDFRMGYWEEPVSCSAAPDDLEVTIRFVGETGTMVIVSPVTFQLVPC